MIAPDSVSVVPVDEDGNVYLVHQQGVDALELKLTPWVFHDSCTLHCQQE